MSSTVTIGIPVFQAKDYIEATMQSALSQTYPNIEFLIVDDCGNDGTKAPGSFRRHSEIQALSWLPHAVLYAQQAPIANCRGRLLRDRQGHAMGVNYNEGQNLYRSKTIHINGKLVR